MGKLDRWLGAVVAAILLAAAVSPAGAQSPGAGPIATVSVAKDSIVWQPAVEHAGLTLTVSGPDGATRLEFPGGSAAVFPTGGRPDGAYAYELTAAPAIDEETRAALAAAADTDLRDEVVRALQVAGKLPRQALTQSGSFAIVGGAPVLGAPASDQDEGGIRPMDQVIADDLITQGSICTGFDCVNNESFGFDTIRLKENNLRIKFEDTSVGTFPSTDWQLTANDSASGGLSKFSIEDVTGAKVPFTVVAGAPTNSLYVGSNGDVGVRTSTPVLDLHMTTGDTPAVRFEQTSGGGFTAQTWDIGANEANFFVRDVTGGSRLPFRIRPGAPTSSIDIAANGNVGIGTMSPTAKLDVIGSAVISGSLTLNGALIEFSDANAKENFAAVDGRTVLNKLARMPIRTWNYRGDAPSVRHTGPTAQDFHAAFGLGIDETHIATLDANGVALAGIQELYRMMQERDEQIARLRQQNADLAGRIHRMESGTR